MQCPKCSTKVSDGIAFCPNCGFYILKYMQSTTTVTDNQTTQSSKLQGIGGWLIIVAINLMLKPLGLLAELLTIPKIIYDLQVKGFAYYYIIFANLIMIAYLIVCNVYFYRKKRDFIKLGIIYYASYPLYLLIFIILINAEAVAEVVPELIGSFLGGIPFILYLLKSKRVKATFVN